MDVIDWVCVAAIFCGALIYVPILIYFLYQFGYFSSRHNIAFFRTRIPVLVCIINILCILIIVFERPYLALYYVLSSHTVAVSSMPHWTFTLMHSMLWFALLIIICLKFYLLYFNQQYNLALRNQAWKNEINIGVTGLFASFLFFLCACLTHLFDTCLILVCR